MAACHPDHEAHHFRVYINLVLDQTLKFIFSSSDLMVLRRICTYLHKTRHRKPCFLCSLFGAWGQHVPCSSYRVRGNYAYLNLFYHSNVCGHQGCLSPLYLFVGLGTFKFHSTQRKAGNVFHFCMETTCLSRTDGF